MKGINNNKYVVENQLYLKIKRVEDISTRIGDNINAKGNIKLYTDLYPWPSCKYVIEEFIKKYNNIKVDIIYKLDVLKMISYYELK